MGGWVSKEEHDAQRQQYEARLARSDDEKNAADGKAYFWMGAAAVSVICFPVMARLYTANGRAVGRLEGVAAATGNKELQRLARSDRKMHLPFPSHLDAAEASTPLIGARRGVSTSAKRKRRRLGDARRGFATQADHYQTLGVAEDASREDIKRAFYQRAKAHHPDLHCATGIADDFKSASAAYEVLQDETKRKQYDMQRLLSKQQAAELATMRKQHTDAFAVSDDIDTFAITRSHVALICAVLAGTHMVQWTFEPSPNVQAYQDPISHAWVRLMPGQSAPSLDEYARCRPEVTSQAKGTAQVITTQTVPERLTKPAEIYKDVESKHVFLGKILCKEPEPTKKEEETSTDMDKTWSSDEPVANHGEDVVQAGFSFAQLAQLDSRYVTAYDTATKG